MKLTDLRSYISQLNWLMVTFTLLVFGGLIKLGFWQSDRATEKEQRLISIAQYQSQPALNYQALAKVMGQLNNINDLPLQLSGEFDPKHVFLLDNQTNQGQLGYRVLQAFSFEGVNALVNLGWVKGSRNRNEMPQIKALNGQYTIKGNIRIVDNTIVLTAQDYTKVNWPLRVQQIELGKFSTLIGKKLLPFVIYLDKTELIGFEKNWQAIVMPPEKHRAYAFQWFSLAIAWLILMVYSSIYWARQDNNNKKV
ncbi:SURF1 family protein [Thalassotalea piscium]|uniref:SURF1-like protein n=1 Tax=Thalassotalea piscium TaxID=1230533 RepID=A0A7X0NG33_9GAMM|nr:SURF1 family protein [Thalassotalea piscium]MBB6542832.1 cytochrome oxidase assembly protein ShyY1 [Thalassotalea piscium]